MLIEVEGEPEPVERFLARLARRGAAAGDVEAVEAEDVEPRGERGFAIVESERRRRARGARSRPTPRPARSAWPRSSTRRPPLPLPVHQLHQLRAAVHDRPRRSLRPAADDDGGVRDVRAPAGPSTRTRATAASTPSPTPAPTAGRALGCSTPPGAELGRGGDAVAAAADAARAAARSSRSRGSAATTSPAAPTTRRRSRRCARASTARTSRSR